MLAVKLGFRATAKLSLSANVSVKSKTCVWGEGITPFLAGSASGLSNLNCNSAIVFLPSCISTAILFCLSLSPSAALKSLSNLARSACAFIFFCSKSAPISASTPASATSLSTFRLACFALKKSAVGSSNAFAKLAIVLPPPVSDKPRNPPWINNWYNGSTAGWLNFSNAYLFFQTEEVYLLGNYLLFQS